MKNKKETKKSAGISDEAVRAKTGKEWQEWFKILDKAGATKMTHKDIARYLREQHQVSSWWCQMVTVAYEQARSMRKKHETPGGYQISRSKTIAVPVAKLYKAWSHKKSRECWLPQTTITIHKATPEKSLRITWVDGKTSVEVNFYTKGNDKCQVVVQHSKLVNAKDAERMKAYWGEKLDALKDILEA